MPKLLLACLVLLCSVAVAGPAELKPAELKKVGEAELRVLFWSIYTSRLYSVDGQYREGQRPLQLQIEYLIDIESGALVERTGSEWDSQGLNHER